MAPPRRNKVKSYVIYGGLGLSLCTEIAVAGLIGWWAGAWIDTKLGIRPWGTTVGIMGFVTLSFVHIVGVLTRLAARIEKEDS